jgi:hypothetical protein
MGEAMRVSGERERAMSEQRQLPHCRAPCWPIDCRDCPFGNYGDPIEVVWKWLEEQPAKKEATG